MTAPAFETIASRSNAGYKRLLDARRHGRADGLLLLEGRRLIEEALQAGLELVEVAASAELASAGTGVALLARLSQAGARVRLLSDALLRTLSELETPPGLLALARPPAFGAAPDVDAARLLLVAVGVQNPGNLGGLLRTAEAAGATGAWLTRGCADPLGWKSLRGAMGSAFRLPQRRGVAVAGLADELRRAGLRSVAADARASRRHDEVDLRGPVAILLGSEGQGLPPALLEAVELRVRIPLRPPVESLNVGVAAGVLLFEAARQRGFVGMLE